MQRYRLQQGKLRPNISGEWVRWDDIKDIAEILMLCDKAAELLSLSDKTDDGVPFLPYQDPRTFFCLWQYEGERPKISACSVPQDEEEMLLGDQWLVRDAKDDCHMLSVWSTREAAEKALGELTGDKG